MQVHRIWEKVYSIGLLGRATLKPWTYVSETYSVGPLGGATLKRGPISVFM
jgi:hypothetical protein